MKNISVINGAPREVVTRIVSRTSIFDFERENGDKVTAELLVQDCFEGNKIVDTDVIVQNSTHELTSGEIDELVNS